MHSLKILGNRNGLLALLDEMLRADGTDLHLKVPGRPQIRTNKRLVPLSYDPLTPDDTQTIARVILEMAREEAALGSLRDHRVCFGVEGKGRFRAQISKQRGSLSIVIHSIATEAPTLSRLGILDGANSVIQQGKGLILVTGGRNRQAAIAAMVKQYNQNISGHIISIENPIEYLHRDSRACVSQREVGIDVLSVADGIEAALYQDPDALAVSDVASTQDAELVLRAAEEGLMVFAGIAAPDGGEAVRVFARRFPSHREEEVASRVAGVIAGVIHINAMGMARWMTLDAQSRLDLEAGKVFRPRLVH